MEVHSILSSLPKELEPVLSKLVGKPVVVTASTRNNIAKDNAVQVCGPVAGHIEYVFNLSFHYHAGEKATCWRVIGGSGFDAGVAVSENDSRPGTRERWAEASQRESNLLPRERPFSAVQAPIIRTIHLHSPRKESFPVLATVDPDIDGNWIASRIVKRLELSHSEAEIHKEVPVIKGCTFKKTRLFVDLSCGNLESGHQCQHRFYVVNHCDVFDLLLGARHC
ncbi:hypothetical protein BKA65DRAFT_206941 [Rhexocercosporidium sp. MPI-PUGE-AT-0058]|nr:hypothetical protein BKA65DRAFT_206941 [Rhexocercosporidium sp. MPI-PUGE-AT-0058]